MKTRQLLKAALALSLLCTAFLGGFTLNLLRNARDGRNSSSSIQSFIRMLTPPFARADDAATTSPPEAYRTALAAIHDDYFGTAPATTRLTYSAIDGMLETIGDPYTVFWTPKEYRENMETNSGDFVGIGAKLDTDKNRNIVITEPMEDSPSAAAGILAGDLLASIDGRPTVGMTMQAVIDLIHGPEGTSITLKISRKGVPHTFTMQRAVVHTRIVDFRMVDPVAKVGYIRLGMFNEQADVQFDAALRKLEAQRMRALVFDLRDNPGGLLQVAQDLASRFIPDGPIVWVKEKNGRMSSLNVEREKHRGPLSKGEYPVVVLVNGDSASAAEIVAGALQDSGAATLAGTSTYGKGLVQTIMPLADDSAVKITTQHYFTRDKHDINVKRDLEGRAMGTHGGITPNVIVEFTDKELAAQRAAERAAPRNTALADRYDPQLQKGLQIVRQKLANAGPRAL
jgi:carboxyl-terminal processing protease